MGGEQHSWQAHQKKKKANILHGVNLSFLPHHYRVMRERTSQTHFSKLCSLNAKLTSVTTHCQQQNIISPGTQGGQYFLLKLNTNSHLLYLTHVDKQERCSSAEERGAQNLPKLNAVPILKRRGGFEPH